jgi:signal transduction histidine kinase
VSLPGWASSIRARLTALYSLVLFGLMALVLALVYLDVRADIDDAPVATNLKIAGKKVDGSQLLVEEAGDFTQFEQVVNDRTLDTLRSAALVSLGALGVLSLGVGWVLSGRALRPVARITDVAAQIEANDLTRRIALPGPDDELKRMADTFDRMLDRLAGAFEAQRQLVDDASHELRNPLAIMRTNLDVALRDPQPSVQRLQHAATVTARAAERMTRQVDDLLAAARQPSPLVQHREVELAPLLHETAEEFEAAARLRSLTLRTDVRPDAALAADRDALKRAVSNLVDNAVRLAPEGSVVRLVAGQEGGWRWIAVVDQGPGIDAAEHKQVFERAWSANGASSGLGLAIVRQIVEAHGGVVRLHSDGGRGSRFVLWLPARAQREVLWAPPDHDPVGAG